jgi:hypothetical protein
MRSRNFSGTDEDGHRSTTTWGIEEIDGEIISYVVEERTGAPTVYPVEDAAGQPLTGHTASYNAWKQAQTSGRRDARRFAYRLNPDAEALDRQRATEQQQAYRRIRERAISGEYRRRRRKAA